MNSMTAEVPQKRRERAYTMLIAASFLLYIVMTVAKNLYTAEKTTLYGLGTFGNLTELASTMEYYFYTYALMQVLLLFIIKRINIKWFLTITIGLSAVLTACMALTNGIGEHYVMYAINGILQAGLWGGSIKVLSLYLPARRLPLANQLMSAAPAISGAGSYGVAALFGENWRLPFFVLGVLLLLSVLLYFISVTRVARFPREVETHHVVYADGTEADVSDEEENDFIHLKSRKRVLWFYVLSILISGVMSILYFAVYNNLDMFLKEIGNFHNDTAKWLTLFAPLVAAIGPILVVNACEKYKNFIAVGAVCFALSGALALLLAFVFDWQVYLSLFLVVAFLTAVNGGRVITLSIVSLRMRQKIDAGVFSMAVNVAASVAAGLAPKMITVFLDMESLTVHDSWLISFALLFAINALLLLSILAVFLGVKRLNRKDARNGIS